MCVYVCVVCVCMCSVCVCVVCVVCVCLIECVQLQNIVNNILQNVCTNLPFQINMVAQDKDVLYSFSFQEIL